MNRISPSFRVAVIGAGIAGATCARALLAGVTTAHARQTAADLRDVEAPSS